jgi:hypothetical protein
MPELSGFSGTECMKILQKIGFIHLRTKALTCTQKRFSRLRPSSAQGTCARHIKRSSETGWRVARRLPLQSIIVVILAYNSRDEAVADGYRLGKL